MHKLLIAGFAGAAIVAAALGGYRLGAGTWPEPVTWLANMAQGPIHANVPRTLEALSGGDAHAPLDHREGWGHIRWARAGPEAW
jgi:hypothetical protein